MPDATSVTYQASGIDLPFAIPQELQLPVGSFNTPRIQQSFQDLVTRAYIQADYSVAVNALGAHDLKMGVGTQKTVNNVDLA